MNSLLAASSLLVLIGVALGLVGGVMVRRGRKGLRKGDLPHCRRCEYPLVGIASDHCPECGVYIIPANVVRGERIRRPWLTGVGAVLALAGLATLGIGVTGAFERIDWYRLKPTAWLISDVESAPPPAAARAWAELRRRSDAGGLSAGQRGRMADVLLARQATAPRTQQLREMIDWLATAAEAGQLAPEQKDRFYRQIVQLQLRVRKKVAAGDPIPYAIDHGGRGPSAPAWWTRVGSGAVAIDGRQVRGAVGGSSGFSGMGAGGSSGSTLPAAETSGTKTVAATVRVQVYRGPEQFAEENPATELLHEHDVVLTDTTEVFADPPADLVRPVRVPDAEAVRASLRPKYFGRSHDSDQLRGMVDVINAPIDVAFDLFARAGGKEYALGGVTWKKGANGGWRVGGRLPSDASVIDLVFRASAERARSTVDLYEFWDGEIVFTNVPVETSRPTTRPALQPSPK